MPAEEGKGNEMRINWGNRLLITYLPIFLVGVLSVSICFFLFVNYMSQEQAKHATGIYVNQVVSQIDQTLKHIDRVVVREVNYNERLHAFFDGSSDDKFNTIAEPSRVLQEMIALVPEIDSIYLYSIRKQEVLSVNVLSHLKDYHDQAFILDIVEQGGSMRWLPADIQMEYMELLSALYNHLADMREKNSARSQLKQVRQFIDEHYAIPEMSLNLLGEHFGIHIKSLSQMFKEEWGEKFVDYLARVRIQHAAKLLEETEIPIQDIAVKVGYLHVHTFARVFKKMMNMTPGDYRKQHARP